ncbi:MAG: response regulator, partial [Saprospiraceae bacterium]|nr:response regulator [Saprospiraceae bacterium]
GRFLRHLNKSDGLQANEFGYETFAQSKYSGQLYFGGNNGFNIINPANVPIDTCPPNVQISEILLLTGNKMVSQLDVVAANGMLPIKPFQKVLTVRFAGLDFESPLRNQFSCKLEGFDDDWRMLGTKDEITYTNLDPGDYVLQVKSSNKDGIWSRVPATMAITVYPPWWETWWAWILYTLLIAAVVVSIYQYQLSHQRAQAEAQKIRELDKMKSRLYTNITHEFRTPLTVITAMSDLIEKPEKSKELIQRNADSLLRLVNQLLDLSKVESGHLKLNMIQADVVPFVQYLTESFNSYAANKNINLVTYMESEVLIMDFDEYKLHSIISNLLSNAVKFTPEGGKIILHLKEVAGKMVIKVKDTGIGIPEDKLPLIFDQFYQVDDSSTRKGEGTGIGLTLTKELIELMKGTITVKSQPGGGTEFKVALPITREARLGEITKVQISPNLPPPDKMEEADFSLNAKLPILLLIEDNADVATYLQIWLKGKYEVLHARNGALGIKMAKEVIPDVVITDVMMPEKDGFEVCRTLKNDETTSHVPIIVLTAKTDDASRIEGLERGADAYLSKPFIKKELLVRLQSLIDLRKKLQARYSQPQSVDSGQVASLEDQFLQKVLEAIDKNLSDTDFSNANLASLLHLSESQLFRKLKALTGKSTAIYIRSYRLAKGKELLEKTSLTVSEIAYEVGFSDPAYFSRTFSSEFGLSPNAIRK